MTDLHETPTAELPLHPGDRYEFVEVDPEGFAVYRRIPVTPGHYRTDDGYRVIVCAAD